jgi:hypothetical protein
MTYFQQRAIEILKHHTAENKITGKSLAKTIGLQDRRSGLEGADMRAIIHALRMAGFPILADTEGYWYAQTKEELKDFIGRLEHRVGEQQKVIDALKENYSAVGRPAEKMRGAEESEIIEMNKMGIFG